LRREGHKVGRAAILIGGMEGDRAGDSGVVEGVGLEEEEGAVASEVVVGVDDGELCVVTDYD
jgi:hypothetical protein